MGPDAKSRQRPRSWVDLLLLAGSAWALVVAAQAGLARGNVDADIEVVSNEARQLYVAFVRFHENNGSFPTGHSDSAAERDAFDPLKRRGYYRGSVKTRLVDGEPDAYVSSGSGGRSEFWLEMSLASDPTVRFLVTRSDDAPLGGGKWRDGAFVFRAGELEPL